MEVLVRFELSCDNARSAEAINRLFQDLASDDPATRNAAINEPPGFNRFTADALEELVEHHSDNLACLETAEADGDAFRAQFVCGWGAENFLVALASAAAGLEARITRLTAQYDEGGQVCDLIDGKPHLEEFEDYQTFEETGFVDLDQTALLSELLSNRPDDESDGPRDKFVQQSPESAEKYAAQERALLPVAQSYFEDTFRGVPLAFDEWYSDEYRASGALQWFETPEDCAESNKAWADEHGGVKNVDLRIKGQIDGLVSIDAEIVLHDGKVNESNTCWIFQDGRWKRHNSCAQIWIEIRELSDEQAEMLKELEGLFTGFSSGDK